ncbi:DNA-binding transcriptional regulator, MarR family [Amycolatopsis marina]|uniref:DNA-binding transcriptional regulator, MarR family n=1 Tax=Amycolatopsis marina TaxID=490629 RepID=A0A1I1BDY1_9PSEU|nr:MarR family transcriptional regulator [Amycolatopsis marina]SFB48585.1 DNA-binding transcriptional regulator, MarR family [Amycolatopsis marina]
MVDHPPETVNQVVEFANSAEPGPGWELPLLLFAGFRSLIDRLHSELAAQGHPEVRPAHGFAMQAIGRAGITASELGKRLGVSKQAAGKTVDRLERLGYARRLADDADSRRRLVTLTPRGIDALTRSAAIFEQLRAEWATTLGDRRLGELTAGLRTMAPADGFRMDVAGWFGN